MRTSGEVCEYVGISRKTLRGYNEIGLIKPTKTTEVGYALYDDAAVWKLVLIQALASVGYERKSIKELFESEKIDIASECDRIIELLEKRKKLIDGKIAQVKFIKQMTCMPPKVIRAVGTISTENFPVHPENMSFAEGINSGLEDLGAVPAEEMEEITHLMPIFYSLIALGTHKSNDIESKEVRECFDAFANSFWNLLFENEDQDELVQELADVSEKDFGEYMKEQLLQIIGGQNIVDFVEKMCGQGAGEFVMKVFKTYKIAKPKMKKKEEN